MAKASIDNHDVNTLSLIPETGTTVTKALNASNTYTSNDAGKVVKNNGGTYQLAAQTSQSVSISANGSYTYDTTENNNLSVNVSVSGGSPTLGTKSITENGTYLASSDNYDAYSSVTVNVSDSGGGPQSGTFDVSEATGTVTFNSLIGTTLNHFMIKPRITPSDGVVEGVKSIMFVYIDFSSNSYTNSMWYVHNETSLTQSDFTATTGDKFSFNRTTGVFAVNDIAANYSGAFQPSVTYEWFAW